MFKAFAYCSLLVLLVSCKKGHGLDCFKSNGKDVMETRYPGAFTNVTVNDKIELVLEKGTEYKVTIQAGEHIIKHIDAKVNGGVLQISNGNTCNIVRGYKRKVVVTVTAPYVWQVENNGVGDVQVNDFSQDSIKVTTENSGDMYLSGSFNKITTYSHGNGDIYMDGSCVNLNVFMYGTNFLYAKDLAISNYVFVETVSIGDCHIQTGPGSTLAFRIWRDGNIYYKGTPSAISSDYEQNCKGRLIAD